MAKARKVSDSKLRTLYGMSVQDMVNRWGKSRQSYYDLHYRGKLQLFLDDPEKFTAERYSKTTSKYQRTYGMKLEEIREILGLPNQCMILGLHKAGLLKCCIDFAKEKK